MLVYSADAAVVIRYFDIEYRFIAKLLDYRRSCEVEPYGIVGEVVRLYLTVDKRSRSISVRILILKNPLESFKRNRRIDTGKTIGIA